MKLFLLRHSRAEKGGLKKIDRTRKLTSEGKILAFKKAKKFNNKLGDVDVILTSPYPRALETAEIFSSVLNKQDVLNVNQHLTPSAKPADVIKLLGQLGNFRNVLLIGHQPWMTQLASLLIAGHQNCNLVLRKCGLMIIDLPVLAPGKGVLVTLR